MSKFQSDQNFGLRPKFLLTKINVDFFLADQNKVRLFTLPTKIKANFFLYRPTLVPTFSLTNKVIAKVFVTFYSFNRFVNAKYGGSMKIIRAHVTSRDIRLNNKLK